MVDIGSVVGGYRLLRPLGEGGFGAVYLGEDPSGRLGAVKVLHARHEGDAEFRRLFAREVELARKVSSFCTARLLGADPGADPPWVVTEYVEGRTLSQIVRDEGPRADSDLYRLAVSTATALAAIHVAGVVHRDFNPNNIMLAPDGPRVIDFGIARALEGTRASASSRIGTLHYMAPEQVEGRDVTRAIDLFAWGAVIVYAATGRRAFDGPSQAAVIHRILTGAPDLGGVPDSLLLVVTRCLDKDPDQRPTAHELLSLLLGYGPDDTDRRGVLSEGEGVGTGRLPVPAPVSTVALAKTNGRSHPFVFQGRDHITPGDLAEAIQMDWDGAVSLLRSSPQRRALLRWLPEDSPAQEFLSRAPNSLAEADIRVAWLVAHLRPDLPPSYQGYDMTLSRLLNPAGEFTARVRRNELISQRISEGLLEPLSRHHCREPAHGCTPGGPCARYRDLARDVAVLFSVAGGLNRWTESLNALRLFDDDRFSFRPAPGRLLADLSADRAGEPPAEDLVHLAVSKLPDGLAKERAQEAVRRSEVSERRVVARVVRELGGSLTSMHYAQHNLAQLKQDQDRYRKQEVELFATRAERNEHLSRSDMSGVGCFLGGLAVLCLVVAIGLYIGGLIGWAATAILLAVAVGAAAVGIVSSRRRGKERDEKLREIDARLEGLKLPDRVSLKGFNHELRAPVQSRLEIEEALEELPRVVLPGSKYRQSADAPF